MLLEGAGQLAEAGVKVIHLVLVDGTLLRGKVAQGRVGGAEDGFDRGAVVFNLLLQQLH